MTHRHTILLLLMLILAKVHPATAELGSKAKPIHPNIILINVDDLGWKDVGFMGSRYYETPNIDRLASEGMVFMQAYAGAANCAPSRACLMSGQNTPRHGIYTVSNSDRGDVKTRKIIPTPNNETLADFNVHPGRNAQRQWVSGIFLFICKAINREKTGGVILCFVPVPALSSGRVPGNCTNILRMGDWNCTT